MKNRTYEASYETKLAICAALHRGARETAAGEPSREHAARDDISGAACGEGAEPASEPSGRGEGAAESVFELSGCGGEERDGEVPSKAFPFAPFLAAATAVAPRDKIRSFPDHSSHTVPSIPAVVPLAAVTLTTRVLSPRTTQSEISKATKDAPSVTPTSFALTKISDRSERCEKCKRTVPDASSPSENVRRYHTLLACSVTPLAALRQE